MKAILILCVLVGVLAAVASPQLEALKDSWRTEKAALPKSVEEWRNWREGDKATLKAAVETAAPMNPFLVTRLVEGRRADHAVVAIGGSGETLDSIYHSQGRHFESDGFTVLMVEMPPDDIARICLERGTSYLGYATAALLPELKKLRGRCRGVIWSGFSLGTELMMSAATLDSAPADVFIYNDFLCRSKERLIVLDFEPNGMRNLTPRYFLERDFPERMLALSDHPIIFTEGGLDRDFDIVRSIFPDNVTCLHQPRYRDVARSRLAELPRHLSYAEYFRLCNVDPANHYYKIEVALVWLKKIVDSEGVAKTSAF